MAWEYSNIHAQSNNIQSRNVSFYIENDSNKILELNSLILENILILFNLISTIWHTQNRFP